MPERGAQASRGSAPRRIVVHDYSGHPFQVQLSRELAARGHVVDHQYCPSYTSGRGDMERRPSDAAGLTITGVRLRHPFARYNLLLRVVQELEYSVKAFRAVRSAHPDVAILCNIPLLANFLLVVMLTITHRCYIFWHQDVYSAAIRDELHRRLPRPAALIAGTMVEGVERWIASHASHIVAITPAFLVAYNAWGLSATSYSIIPNWAEIGHFTDPSQDRGWLKDSNPRRHVILYSGTLGLKHDPGLLLRLATDPRLQDCSMVVLSEGRGREWLAERGRAVDKSRLILRDYVPFHQLPQVLASADVLISILEPKASRFSVPSKVLTYLCAGRPIVVVMDPGNAAARMLTDNAAGVVVAPSESASVPERLRDLLDDVRARENLGKAARRLAEEMFDIASIADRFERVIELTRR